MTSISTGDILLFARSAYQSHWFRAFSDSPLEHSGIAIRLKCPPDEAIKLKGDLKNQLILPGEPFDPINSYLYVLDQMISEKDLDILTNELTPGFRICDYHSRIKNYRWVICRNYDGEVSKVSKSFPEKFNNFCQKYRGTRFMKGGLNIIQFWLGFDLSPEKGMTCTMLTAAFLKEVLDIDIKIGLLPHHFIDDRNEITREIVKVYPKVQTVEIIPESLSDTVIPTATIGFILIILFIMLTLKLFSTR